MQNTVSSPTSKQHYLPIMTQAEFSQGLELPHCSAYEAYQKLLRGLLLREFPCGLGEWREDHNLIQAKIRTAKEKGVSLGTLKPNLTDYTSSVTLKDVTAGAERTETLAELAHAKESPWFQTCDWTDEGARLRDLAVSEPWTLSQARVNSLLRTLKVHDKNVGEIDQKMKQLKNLEQLVISANYLCWIEGHNLPASLRVLELHGNFIDDLSGLTRKPPPNLEHLGVGRNNLAYTGDHLNGIYWPCLLSLDLSFNHLEDLKGLLEGLGTLPKLRSLVLAGNPLTLTPWYRGYTIDQLRKLLTLDDVKISADEKHNYKGMVRRGEFVVDQCQLMIRVNSLKNLPIPPEIATPDEFPEFPITARKYHVRFWLPFEDTTGAGTAATEMALENENGGEPATADEAALDGSEKMRKSTGFMSDIPEEPLAEERGDSAVNGGGRAIAQGASGPWEPPVQSISGTLCCSLRSSERAYAELTSPTDEAARDRIGWEGQAVRCDLRMLRDFLLHSVRIEIIEEKSLLYPPDQLPQDSLEPGKLQGQEKKKDEKKDDSKPKKKKKVDEGSLVVYSTESTSLACASLDLSELLTSPAQWVKLEVKSQAQSTGTPAPTVPSTPGNADKRSRDARGGANGKDDKKKDKAGKIGSAKQPQAKKNPGKDQASSTEDTEELTGEKVPLPVLAEVEIQRVQWRSVKDCPTAVVIAVEQN